MHKYIKQCRASIMTTSGDDFCTAGKGVEEKHCGCIKIRIAECAVLAANLIQKCAQMPLHDPAVREFVKGIGLETCCLRGGDVYAYYNNYTNEKTDANGAVLCSALWRSINPDKERPDAWCKGDMLVVINFQEYVKNLINDQDSSCTHMAEMVAIIDCLTKFIQAYHQYLSRTDIKTLLDRLIDSTFVLC